MHLMEWLETDQHIAPPNGPGPAGFESPGGFLYHFHLDGNPFADSINPDFFYKTDAHEVAMIRMMLAVSHDISLGLVTGVSGTGKTMLTQIILRSLDPARYKAALILVTPGMSKTAFLKEILSELELSPGNPHASAHDLLKRLGDEVIDLHDKKRKLVLLIDECHFLSAASLHMLRTISNIEVPEQKLTTSLLFGERHFLKRLEHPGYESLRNRMYLRSELPPLERKDTEQFIKFRLLTAGSTRDIFHDSCFDLIHQASQGIGRRINKLCMLALLEAFSRHKEQVDAGDIAACSKTW
ncbi:MAG: AAA family ATPase [Lentisphaerota bacterium]